MNSLRNSWCVLLASTALLSPIRLFAQDQPAASQPSSQPEAGAATQPIEPRAVPRVNRRSTTSRPSATTQESSDERLRRLNEMNQAAGNAEGESGSQPAVVPPVSPGGAAQSQPRISTTPTTTRRVRQPRTAEEIRAEIEEAKRRAAASTQNAPGAAPKNPSAGENGQPPQTEPARSSRIRRPSREIQPATQSAPAVEPGAEAAQDHPGRDVQPSGAGRDVVPGAGMPGRIDRAPARGNGRAVEPGAPPATAANEPAGAPPIEGDRTEWFNYADMEWEDVVKQLAKRLGKPLMANDVIVSGKLTYQGKRRFTMQEAIDELNFLLAEQGYFIAETENYVYLVPLNEIKKFLSLGRMFDSYESFEAASLRDMEFCSVMFKIADQPAEKLRDMLASAMPDYAIPTVTGNTNSINITGLAKDVRRFKGLLDVVKLRKYDPREMRIYAIKTNVAQVERMVQALLGVDPASQAAAAAAAMRRVDAQGRPLPALPQPASDSDVKIIADERTKQLIVKATPEQHEEVKNLIDQFDSLRDLGKFDTHVMPVRYANATEVKNMLQQIFDQEQGAGRTPFRTQFQPRQPIQPRPGQPNQPVIAQPANVGGVAPEDIIVEDAYELAKKTVRIVADERTNSLIVYANEDGVKRVEDMLDVIDQPVPTNYQQFKLEHARVEQIAPLVDTLAKAISATAVGTRGARGPTVTPDEPSNTLHVIADRREMDRIAELVEQLDVEGAEEQRHVVQLNAVKPTEMKPIVEGLLRMGAGGAARGARRGPGAGPAVAVGEAVIALDAARMLIVTCTDEQWTKIEDTIRTYDQAAVTDRSGVRFFEIANGNPDAIANTVKTLFSNYVHPVLTRVNVNATSDGDRVVVNGPEAVMEDVAALIAQLDVQTEGQPLVVIALVHADATTVQQYVQNQILGQRGVGGRVGGGQGAGTVQADPATNALIVQTDESTLKRIRSFVAEMEQRYATQSPERRFFKPRNAAPNDVVNTINTLFGSGGGFAGPRGRGASAQSMVKAVTSGNQVVVEAPAEKLPEIAKVIEELDNLGEGEIIIKTIKLAGADVNAIAQRLTNAFQLKTKQSGSVARFEADASSETILLTCSRDLREECEERLAEYTLAYKPLIPQTEFYQLKNATAQEAASWLQGQLAAASVQLGKAVAQQVKIAPDARTNKVIISAPAVVVEMALQLLQKFDEPLTVTEQPPPPVATETRKLPGMDVQTLAQNLQRHFDSRPPRGDKLRFVFSSDAMSSMLIFTAPMAAVGEVDELIAKFAADSAEFVPADKFFDLRYADSAYVKEALTAILTPKLQRRGAQASQVSVNVDPRLNRVHVFGPKLAVDMASELITELDKEATSGGMQTIVLRNADATTVVQNLTTLRSGSQNRSRIVAEALTNSVIVSGASKQDFEEIRKFVEELDTNVASKTPETRVVPISNANPQDIVSILQNKYAPRSGQRSRDYAFSVFNGKDVVIQAPPDKFEEISALVRTLDQPTDSDVLTIDPKFADANDLMNMINGVYGSNRRGGGGQSVSVNVTNGTLIVRAPKQLQPAILELVTKVDAENPNQLTVQTFPLKVLQAPLVGGQVNAFLQSLPKTGKRSGLQPAAFGEPSTNTLVVIAPKDQMGFVKSLIDGFELGTNIPQFSIKPYVLKNQRAADLAQNVQTMLAAKATEEYGAARAGSMKILVSPDSASNQLMIFAPDELHELAGSLLQTIDKDVESGDITRIVQLISAEAAQVAQTLNARLTVMSKGSTPRVTVVGDAGSNSLILSGPPKDVAETQKLITDLEENSNSTPELQIFSIKNVSTTKVKDTLDEIFETIKGKGPQDAVSIVEDEYYGRLLVTTNRRKMRHIEALIEQLDVRPEEADTGGGLAGRELHFVEISRGDASDIVWDVEDLLPSKSDGGPELDADWDGEYIKVLCRPGEFPKIEKLIRQFEAKAKVEKVYKLRKVRGDMAKILPLLSNQVANIAIDSTQARTELPSIVEDVWPEGTEPDSRRRENVRPVGGDGRQNYLPDLDGIAAFVRRIERVIALGERASSLPRADAAQDSQPATRRVRGASRPATTPKSDAPAKPADGAATAQPRPNAEPADKPTTPVKPAATERPTAPASEPAAGPTDDGSGFSSRSPLAEAAKIVAMPDGRSVTILGSKKQVDEIEEVLDLLEEDLAVGQVIRIFRFRYGDVTAAARILEMMFNDGVAGNAAQLQAMQQQMQMQAMQQQMQQQQQRGGNQQGGRGGRGDEERGGAGSGGMMDAMRAMMGGGGEKSGGGGKSGPQGPKLRIATDPSHNYLIVKCDESDLPEIRQLLRELDIKPSNVDLRVFQLKNLVASETANNLKEALGLSRNSARNQRSAQNPQAGRNPQQQQLMEIMQQQMVSLPGIEGAESARTDSVEIVPNDLTNSLLVSAPKEVMTIIQNVIGDLEELEQGDVVVIQHYPLEKAFVADVLPLLQEIFDATSGGGNRRGGGGQGGGRGGASPADLGPVVVSGDPRSNSLIYTCQAKDVRTVEAQIKMLDIEQPFAQAEIYTVQYGVAEDIAAAVTQIFQPSAAGGRGGGRGERSASGAASELRISAEPSTNTIIVWGTIDQRDRVMVEVEKLDELSKRQFRDIPVVLADAEKLADKLATLFGGTSNSALTGGAAPGAAAGGRNRRGGAAGAIASIPGRIVVLGDKISKKLYVRAPDPIFEQMNDLVTQLDKADPGLQIRAFPLKYADASVVVDAVKSAMLEFMQVSSATGGAMDFDAFTAMADPRTNSVMIVGSDETFVFVKTILDTIDIRTPEDRQKQFRIFVLDRADANTVADAINNFAIGATSVNRSGGSTSRGGDAGGGRRGGGLPSIGGGGAGLGSAPILDVHAIPEPTTNSVMVFGRPEDIDRIEEVVISPLEDALVAHRQFARLKLQNAVPSQFVSFIQPFIDEMSGAGGGGGGDSRSRGSADRGPMPISLMPNDGDKSLLVRGSAAQVREVERLIEEFDRDDLNTDLVKIIPVPVGQDAVELARSIQQLINQGEQEMARKSGRQPRSVTVQADSFTNAIMVYGDQSMYGMVTNVVDQLGKVRSPSQYTVVRRLNNLSPAEAQALIDDLLQRRASGTSGAIRRTGTNTGNQPRGGNTGQGRGGFNPGDFGPFTPGGNTGGTRIRPNNPNTGGGNRGGANTGGGNRGGNTGGGNRGGGGDTGGNRPRNNPGGGAAPNDGALWGAASFSPRGSLVSTVTLASLVLFQAVNPEPANAQPASPPKPASAQPASPPAAMRPRTAAASQPASSHVVDTLGHNLRGDIISTPLGGDGIIISGEREDVEFIERMLDLLEAATPEVQIQIFNLQYVKAGVIQPILQNVLESWQGTRGVDQRFERFSIIAEGRSNSLIVSASEDNLVLIEELIRELDSERMTDGVGQKLIALEHIRATEAAAILEPVIQRLNEVGGGDQQTEARVTAIPRGNSLLVVGTPTDVAEIQQIIRGIDVEIPPAGFSEAQVLIVDLINAKADDLAELLNELVAAEQAGATGGGGGAGARGTGNSIVRRLSLTTADGRELPPLDLDRPIKISSFANKNSLIIYSSQKNNAALGEIVRLFDALPKTVDVDVKSFALKYAQAEKVATTLKAVFDDARTKAILRPGQQSPVNDEMPPIPPNIAGAGLPFQVAITHDVRSNSIFVVGRSDSVLLAAGLISEMDRPGGELNFGHHVLHLENLQAGALQERLSEMLEKRAQALGSTDNLPRDSAVMMVDDRSNSLVVICGEETWKMIDGVARQLDALASYKTVDTRFRRLKLADSAKLANLLQQVFDKKKDATSTGGAGAARGGQEDSLFAVADPRSNSLVLTGTRDYLEEADRIITDLDKQYDPTVEFVVRPVMLNSAANIASLLTEMVEQAQSGGGGGGASEIRGTPIKISSDLHSNSLLIAASREDITRLERWIELLDSKPGGGRVTKIIPLHTAKAETVAESAGEFYAGGRSGGGGGGTTGGGSSGPDVTVRSDTQTNSVIAIGPPAIVADIEKFVRELDATIPNAAHVVRFFKLEQADAEDAGELLRSMLERRGGSVGSSSGTTGGRTGGSSSGSREDALEQVMLIYQRQHPESGSETVRAMSSQINVIDDVRTNSLVVTAPAESIPLVESLVNAIDVPPEANKIRVFPLRNGDAEETVTMLENLIAQRTGTSQAGRTGGGTTGTGTSEERTLSLGEGASGGRQQVSFTSDKRTNSVIAAGTKGYLDLVEELILQLDSQDIGIRERFVFVPRNAEAPAIQQAIADLNDREQQMLNDLGGEISTSRRQERQIIAVASETTNRVLIDVDPRQKSSLLELMRQLDQPPPQVMIQVLIIEITLQNSLELGVEFAFQDLQFMKAGPNDTTTYDYVGGTDIGAAGASLGGFTFTITGRDFNFLLHTLQSEGSLNVLSRPQIVAMDNELARFEVTNDVPYVSGSAAISGQLTTTVERKDVGIVLEVTPHINPDGFVRMQVKQEVSDITNSTVDIGGGVRAPIFLKRNAETFVTVKDNETVVLGGLIRSRDQRSETKVPFLGDVPGLGLLFRADQIETRREELMVVLTPRIIRTVEDYRELSREERDKSGIIGEDVLTNPLMQGLRVAPEDLMPRRGEENIGPYPKPAPPTGSEDDPDVYGPKRTKRLRDELKPIDPASYDIPVTRVSSAKRSGNVKP